MSERDELADLYADILFRRHGIETSQSKDVADELIAAGYRKPRTVTTAAELAGLPAGSVVLTASQHEGEHGYAWVKHEDRDYPWKGTYGNTADSRNLLAIYGPLGPLTVLHEGVR